MTGRRTAGFTLLEVAIVLAILGFLSFMLAPIIGGQMAFAKYRETREKIDPIKRAISSFVAANNRLPCPAIETLPSTDSNYGKEAPTAGTCTGTTALTGGAVRGVVPWAALGLPAEAVSDGFGRFFTYAVTTTQTNLTSTTLSGAQGVIAVHSATPISAANQLNTGNLAVYVLISYGQNGYGGFVVGSGGQVPFSGGADELENTNTSNVAFVAKDFSQDTSNPYDDIVVWITPAQLLSDLSSSGVKSPQGVFADRAQSIKAALVSYVANQNGNPGGTRTHVRNVPCADTDNNGSADTALTGTVPYSSLAIPASASQDAWGRPLQYTVTSTGLGPGTLCSVSGSDAGIRFATSGLDGVTITSYGADGAVGGGDDMAYTVTVNDIRGSLASSGISFDP